MYDDISALYSPLTPQVECVVEGFHKFQSWLSCVLVSSKNPSRMLHVYCDSLIIRHSIGEQVHVILQRLSGHEGFVVQWNLSITNL